VGYHASMSTTPHEFLATYAPILSQKPILYEALIQATELYLEARFSLHHLTENEVENVRLLWRRARSQRMNLWLEWALDAPARSSKLLSKWFKKRRG
jgi:hypothetical protein